ncbi:glycoside hydrolase family 15 protein [Lysobacter sp. TY2-98]|uniref:glycoside hydrolase family 15 protein n=1 Tax=Lysobacter sp. TY2-98 TaxID=2290922 RepID=UPI000E2068C1|nr:glycoside hydrolase family 15 protein [Lysobacter sp. TY2-98]AXK71004.1 glycoside hydrolase family 15 protein [Lysobacter sp. TY2-98]
MSTLSLGLVGNGSIGALIDPQARVVWACVPAFDGDPTFCSLLSPRIDGGDFAIELEGMVSSEQHYIENTAVLRTVLRDARGGAVEIIDLAPRWKQYKRFYRPVMLIRTVRPLSGEPRVRVRLRPLADYGARVPESTWGSNHMRFVLPGFTLRLNTDAPVRMVREEIPFLLDREINFILGPDETFTRAIDDYAHEALEKTVDYWREWVRALSVPLEWQDAVIRSAITLKLCQYDETGAIVAAMTTSIPEAADTQRNWDYRYCWLRDSAFVVRALNRLGATRTMEEYLRYVSNLIPEDGHLQPLYGIGLQRELHEEEMPALTGYRGMGPVRRGNLAWVQPQHDVYGSVVLASTQMYLDRRLNLPSGSTHFRRLERLGERAFELFDQPDAGLWEFRGRVEVHTYSAVMCWAACDRLAKIAVALKLDERARFWRERADGMHARISELAFDPSRGVFVEGTRSGRMDAVLLLLVDLGFVRADDPRFAATVDVVGRELRRGDGMLRYVAPDDFGVPETSFTICTFWYVDALAAIGRIDEAREMFERVLARRNPLGLLSEDLSLEGNELWGNFPQTYSHVGLINAAMRLSRPWDSET